MFSTLNSSVYHTNPKFPNNYHGGIRKSLSNNHLDYNHTHYFDKVHTNGSSYALNDTGGEKFHHGLKCHHLSTTNLEKDRPHSFNNSRLDNEKRAINDPNNKFLSTSSILHDTNHEGSIIYTNTHQEFGISKKLKTFASCSKPCGILTFIVGLLLLISSVLFFLLLLDKELCMRLDLCYDSLFKMGMVSAVVIGFFLTFIGLTIIIYIKRDSTASVIVMPSKYISSSNMNSKTHDSKQNSSVYDKKSLKKEDTIDMNEYNFEENLATKNKVAININHV